MADSFSKLASARYRYLVAIVAAVGSALIRLAFLPSLGLSAPYITFYPAVVLAALYGGFGPGLLAAIVSALLADYFWTEPVGYLFANTSADWLAIVIFLVGCTMICVVTEAMHRAKARAHQAEMDARIASARQRGLQALRETEQRFHRMFDLHKAVMLVIDPETGAIVDANAAAAEFYGFSCDKLRSLKIEDVHQLPPERVAAERQLAAQEQRNYLIFPHRLADGQIRWVEEYSAPFDSGGRSLLFSIIHDITQRRQAEDQLEKLLDSLRESEQRYRLLFDRNPDGVYALDTTGRFLVANPAFVALSGYSVPELLGRTYMEMCAPELLENTNAEFQRILREQGFGQVESVLIRKDGRRVEIWAAGEPILASGKVVAVHCTVKDITEKKRAEEDRAVRSKMESTGILAGGIAHDFNNLLTAIILNIDVAQSKSSSGKDVTYYLQTARNGASAAHNLTKQLLTFAKGGAPVRKPVHLGDLIQTSVRVSLSGADVRCDVFVNPGLYWTDADEGQIGQVIRNLVLNARDALPAGGTVCVRADNVTLPMDGGPALPAGKYVRISVIDEGHGIPPEVLPRIFDPYFSTKPRGADKGMGLGLTICHTIVKKHGGTIAVKSHPGVGTSFHFYLPACDKPADVQVKGIAALLTNTDRPRRILVMDDEDCMRTAVKTVLEGEGFQVATARDGREAIELYSDAKNQGCPFDAVMLDLTVRCGMGGKETIRALLEIDPEVKGIVMSGYSDDPVLVDPQPHGFKAAMEKSFDAEQLTRTVSRVLENSLFSSRTLLR